MNAAPIDIVVDLLRPFPLSHVRSRAPELLATAKAQRWESAETMRALLPLELAGRQAASVRSRRTAGLPTSMISKSERRTSGRSRRRPSARCASPPQTVGVSESRRTADKAITPAPRAIKPPGAPGP